MRQRISACWRTALPVLTIGLALIGVLAKPSSVLPPGKTFVNSIGMRFVRIGSGRFPMGESVTPIPEDLIAPLTYHSRSALQKRFPFGDPAQFKVWEDHARFGDYDEKPVRPVRISKPFLMGVFEVTNAQYEEFDPSHRKLRGKMGFSREDNEAVVFVNWHEAKDYCDWLSKKEGLPYRLPTEAEWEYACRAGTTTLYSAGNVLPPEFHKNARNSAFDEPADVVPLTVGKTTPNPWGLFDMHGNVEEWCWDWYGPYDPADRTDPVGRADGDSKVTRGGSHGTPLYFLRSANRMGMLPEAKNWLTGFRVVIGDLPSTKPLAAPGPQRYQQNVVQRMAPDATTDPAQPYFKGPRKFVNVPKDSHGPLYSHHNHVPSITECPNGDLLAVWYTCVQERGRELAVAISRLRYGAEEWETASSFWDTPDRNDHCPLLWFDGTQTIYHFNGLGIAGRWAPLEIVMRTSKDNGVTWSKARLIAPEFGFRSMIAETVIRTREGALILASDVARRYGAADHQLSTIWTSLDGGETWADAGGNIAGVHATVVQLQDGRLMALGRGENIDGWMPMSISPDMGKTWKSTASGFPPITGGQRPALLRLKEGPILFVSFAKDVRHFEPISEQQPTSRYVTNLFAAVSFDDGKTWPMRRVISDNKPDHAVFTMDQGRVRMSPIRSEPIGYMTVTQGHDGLVHLLSSINHYAFNLAWIKQGQPDAPLEPQPTPLAERPILTKIFEGSQFTGVAVPSWHNVSPRTQAGGPRWANDRTGEIGTLDPDKGATIEARVQVSGGGGGTQGFELETYVISGPRYLNRYRIAITPSAVYYWHEDAPRNLANGLDNSGTLHTYRLAIRPDTAVQIYRDGALLATVPAEFANDLAQAPRGSHIAWGAAGAGVEATVGHIAYDLGGAFRP